jgi:hypothetical protein
VKNLAQIIYGAYPDTDLLPIDPAEALKSTKALDKAARRPGGDGLFSFIVAEALEAEDQSRGLCTATA